jgi:hypothetical protein
MVATAMRVVNAIPYVVADVEVVPQRGKARFQLRQIGIEVAEHPAEFLATALSADAMAPF